MKRMIALLAVMLIAATLPAVAQTFSPFDYREQQTINGKYLVYDFPDIELYLPMEWQGRFTVDQREDGISFYQTASYQKFLEEGLEEGGFLFELRAGEDEAFRELPAYADLGYSENAGLHFYLLLPSDYPAYLGDDGIRAEYDEMLAAVDAVASMARIAPSLSFYPGESTDPGMS